MPNPVQIHLALVHLPIAGAFFAVLCLVLAEVTRVRWLWLAGGLLLVFAALGGAGAYFTGEGAEDVMGAAANENEDAFSDAPAWVHRHENRAQYAFIVAGVAGLGGLLLMFLTRQKFGPKPDWKPRLAVLILALGSMGLTVATAASGGDIRHSEIRQGPLEPEKK
jgi:hypothetical protein